MVSEGLFRSDREVDASSTTVEQTVIDSSKRAAQKCYGVWDTDILQVMVTVDVVLDST